ncbi:MAG: S-adenosylmethionine:tRNA ribosyltransferase-isomerase, partial [Odoribacter sp.]|nr:S-adenosylmethionine:tRNA ribosyltransferase-isomerase [Odoribacter sp.]
MKTAVRLEDLRNIRIEDYAYELPEERIARFPLAEREASKLLIYRDDRITAGRFADVVTLLEPGQLLVFNNTKVIHARLFFRKSTGAVIEVFCLEPCHPADYARNFASRGACEWSCLVGNLKKWKEGELECRFGHEGREYVLKAEKREQVRGEVVVHFSWDDDLTFSEVLEACGRIPIPPYLNRDSEASDEVRYQTVYSKEEGSVAAPTAGLHFTDEILQALREKGVRTSEVTLHVGAGTFRPVKAETIGGHDMHTEHLVISRPLVESLKRKEKEVVAVGTTSVRTLESLYWMGVKRLEGMEEFFDLEQWEAYTLPSHYTLQQAMEALEGW